MVYPAFYYDFFVSLALSLEGKKITKKNKNQVPYNSTFSFVIILRNKYTRKKWKKKIITQLINKYIDE